MERHYECMWIGSGALTQEESDALVAEMEGVIRTAKGNVTGTEKRGKRMLAYPIGGQREGYYTLFQLEAEPAAVVEMERKMRLHDQVLRYITVVVDDEARRVEKLAAKRRQKKEKRAKKSQPAPSAEPSAQ